MSKIKLTVRRGNIKYDFPPMGLSYSECDTEEENIDP